jgi:hypothetical protein
MDVTEIDPRDQTWEIDAPRYRVYFHDSHGNSHEHEIAGVEVTEALAWAEHERRDRSFILYACVPHDGIGLVRLSGRDPNAR